MIYSPENILNIIILVMLAVMIGYCVVLNKRLKAFRKIKEEMADIIDQLNSSTSHAQKSIVEFKNVVFEEEKKLDQVLRRASEMADELDMINETGSNLANRIEQGLTGSRADQNVNRISEENLAKDDQEDYSGERISLSDLDKEEVSSVGGADDLRESLRNVR
tara:strand:+ start:67102 stop:67590 length:489 start_codon:yes stop_codon:yes gene_type:complete